MTGWTGWQPEILLSSVLHLGILAYVSSHIEYAGYLNIMYIPGSEELVIFICAFIGALDRFPVVQCLSRPGIHGRYRQLDHWWYHSGICHHHSQRVAYTYSLRNLLGRKPFGHSTTVSYFKSRKKERSISNALFKRAPIHDHFRTT